jgi:hypothetical protein
MRKAEIVLAGFVFITVILIFFGSRNFPDLEMTSGGSPAFYPRVLAGAFAAIAALLLLESILKLQSGDGTTSFSFPGRRRGGSLLLVMFLLLVTPYMMTFLGFLPTSFIILIVFMLRLRDKPVTVHWTLAAILLSAGVIAIVYVVFQSIAKVPLPRGLLFGS